MPKKRKKTKLRPAPILWLLLLINIGIGLNYSYITCIVNVRADGIAPFDQDRVQDILTKMEGKPCSRIDARSVESEVMALQDVDRAELTRNVFGNALLKVTYRTPVAQLDGRPQVALSDDGVLYKASDTISDLPKLQMPTGGPPTLIAFAGSWQPASLASIAVFSRKKFAKRDVRIGVNQRGVVCLNIDSGRVILGSCDDLDLKLKTLESRLQKNPQELNEVQELNLTLPTAPTVVPKKVEKKL